MQVSNIYKLEDLVSKSYELDESYESYELLIEIRSTGACRSGVAQAAADLSQCRTCNSRSLYRQHIYVIFIGTFVGIYYYEIRFSNHSHWKQTKCCSTHHSTCTKRLNIAMANTHSRSRPYSLTL